MSLCFTSCLSMMLGEMGILPVNPERLPKVYTLYDGNSISLRYSNNVDSSMKNSDSCFLHSALETKPLPDSFTVPLLYPESEFKKVNLEYLTGTGIGVISFSVDSKGDISNTEFIFSNKSYLHNVDGINTSSKLYSVMKKIANDSHTEGESHIITIVVRDKWKETKDLGAVNTINEQMFPEGYKVPTVHAFLVEWYPEILNDYTNIKTFKNNDALKIFKYGKIEMINVKSPVGNFSVNKPELPAIGLAKEHEQQLPYSTESLNENKLSLEFKDTEKKSNVDLITLLFFDSNAGGLLNVGKNYILTLKIVKDCKDYFISETGWKIYPQSIQMNNYIRNFVGSTLYGSIESICMEVRVIQNNDDYELVLQPQQFQRY